MKILEITYDRMKTYKKTLKVSDALAERLLKLNGESLIQKSGRWGGVEDPEEVDNDVFKMDDVSSDDFTMIAEDLTDNRDVYDSLNEIEGLEIIEITKK